MKKTLFITLFIAIAIQSFGQVRAYNPKQYNSYISEGDALTATENYFDAYAKYRNAEYWAGNNNAKKQIASDKMANSIIRIKQRMKKADSLLIVANNALAKADEMQLKVETAMFDKAVKEQNKEWKGYANMCYSNGDLKDEGKKILEKIDSLDLSNNALLRLPKEITECPNLKHINLLGNKDIDWQDCFTKVKTTEIKSIYVTVNDLSEIDSTYWHLITGIEILKDELQEIPKNILQQKQLTYLD